jgi:hypothetical protein
VLGMRTGGVAFVLALLGGLLCFGLTKTALGLSMTHAERFLAAVNTVVSLRQHTGNPDETLADALELVALDPATSTAPDAATLIQPLIDKLVTIQNDQHAKLAALLGTSTSTLTETLKQNHARQAALAAETQQAMASTTQDTLVSLQNIPAALSSLGNILHARESDQTHLADIAASLSAVRDALTHLNAHPQTHVGFPGSSHIPANTDVARRLSSAMQNLRAATDRDSSTG